MGTTTTPRVAIITGAARGIGAATARRIAKDGYAVAIFDLDESACANTLAEVDKEGGTALAVGVDVTDAKRVEAAVGRVIDELGAPTALVNNAGVTRDSLIFKMTETEWDMVMDVHLKGSFLMTRAVQKNMVDARFGRIVNISSTAALGNRGQANYSAAKAGLQGFTRTLAVELGPFGVTVNSVAPGFIATEMTAATAERLGKSFEEFKAARAAATPVRRVGEPADVAAAVSFFLREETGFVTGQVLYVSGGPGR